MRVKSRSGDGGTTLKLAALSTQRLHLLHQRSKIEVDDSIAGGQQDPPDWDGEQSQVAEVAEQQSRPGVPRSFSQRL